MTFACLVRVVVGPGRVDALVDRAQQEAASRGIGVNRAEEVGYWWFPPLEISDEGSEVAHISIDDRPGQHGADYLLDFEDYAPESTIGLPLRGEDRLALVVAVVLAIAATPDVLAFGVALTDCGEIERTTMVSEASFADIVLRDCRVHAPPNVLYSFSG